MIRVKISLTYRAVPYSVEIEASDQTDVNYLLTEDLGGIIEKIHEFIDTQFRKVEGEKGSLEENVK